MPKAIKKKAAKPVKTEEGMRNVIQGAREFVGEKRRVLLPAVVALVVIIIGAAGFLLYRANMKSRAATLEYEGYKIYYGLYQKQPLQKAEQYRKALEKFQKAYDAVKSPYSLFYVASCYYEMDRYDDALKTLKELNQRFPDDERFVPLSYYKMAVIDLKKGDKEAAMKVLDTLYNYRTGSLKDLALLESGRVLDSMGKKEDALKKYEELTKNFPDSPFIDEAKARIEAKKG
ncbi:MAG: tetratricopeptide repeat protein [Nitrospirae bacterium]|nr:tetratricopeptide repeat protein [Nitrospirota bacterium]